MVQISQFALLTLTAGPPGCSIEDKKWHNISQQGLPSPPQGDRTKTTGTGTRQQGDWTKTARDRTKTTGTGIRQQGD